MAGKAANCSSSSSCSSRRERRRSAAAPELALGGVQAATGPAGPLRMPLDTGLGAGGGRQGPAAWTQQGRRLCDRRRPQQGVRLQQVSISVPSDRLDGREGAGGQGWPAESSGRRSAGGWGTEPGMQDFCVPGAVAHLLAHCLGSCHARLGLVAASSERAR